MEKAESSETVRSSGEWLVRSWGGDIRQITDLYPPDLWEKDGVGCWWFETRAAREAFLSLWPQHINAMRDRHDPADGIQTRARTIAHVTLKLPSGQIVTLREDFGYGYPADSAHFMFEDGNYACDCNLRTFVHAQFGIGVPGDGCGETIEYVGMEITYEPLPMEGAAHG